MAEPDWRATNRAFRDERVPVQLAPQAVPEPAGFDLIFVTWGALDWRPDLAGRARVVAGFLKPGGRLYLAEGHPAAPVFGDRAPASDAGRPGWLVPYCERGAVALDEAEDYATPVARLTRTRTVTWMHPVAEVVGTLRGAGLALDWLKEHLRVTWRMSRCPERDAEGLWTWPERPWLPLACSPGAVKG